jgi:hypothetical protein
MQRGDRHSAVPGGRMLAKVRRFRPCAWHRFWSPWGNASYWLMQPGDRNSAVPGGQMLAVPGGQMLAVPGGQMLANVRGVCHVPGTDLGAPRRRLPRAEAKQQGKKRRLIARSNS